jgi:hypothetical protein
VGVHMYAKNLCTTITWGYVDTLYNVIKHISINSITIINNNNSVKFLVYLRAEFDSQWSITESARIRNDDDSIQFNSIQFNSLLFMCRANSHKANYRHSTV